MAMPAAAETSDQKRDRQQAAVVRCAVDVDLGAGRKRSRWKQAPPLRTESDVDPSAARDSNAMLLSQELSVEHSYKYVVGHAAVIATEALSASVMVGFVM